MSILPNKDYFEPVEYVKDQSSDPIYRPISPLFTLQSRILPAALPALGVLLFTTQVLVPLVFFKTQTDVALPITESALGKASGFSEFEFSELKERDKNNVLGTTIPAEKANEIPKYFFMSIPKLNIKDAKVQTNSPSLSPDDSIGHYQGSALPGEAGNTFLYGHSVLPFFYNPKNYKTIFSTLDKLEPGDLIYVSYGNKKLTYKVEGKRELKPDKVDPLAEIKPKFLNESTMVLMTCSPMGTKINRYLVDTILINTETI